MSLLFRSGFSELAREKMWSRIHLIPMLQAEEDRDLVRRTWADKARERELLGGETRVYHSDRWVLFFERGGVLFFFFFLFLFFSFTGGVRKGGRSRECARLHLYAVGWVVFEQGFADCVYL